MSLVPSAQAQVHVARALAHAGAQGLDRVDAFVLLGHVLGRPRAWLIAHDDAALTAPQWAAFEAVCAERKRGMPVAYLVGQREFHGLLLQVSPAVLVPRPDTETLVDWALDLLPMLATDRPRVLDLGTGSGAIALAVAHGHPVADVCASDVSAQALAVAQANAQRLGLALNWRQGSWWQAWPGGETFDLVLSNPPYIAAGDPHLAALVHEPLLALSPGGDGLDALRAIIQGAPQRLRPGGWLLLEHGHDQAPAVAALLRAAGLEQPQMRRDLAGQDRCSGARQA